MEPLEYRDADGHVLTVEEYEPGSAFVTASRQGVTIDAAGIDRAWEMMREAAGLGAAGAEPDPSQVRELSRVLWVPGETAAADADVTIRDLARAVLRAGYAKGPRDA